MALSMAGTECDRLTRLSQAPTELLTSGQIIHMDLSWRMFSLYPLDASSIPAVLTAKNMSRQCQTSLSWRQGEAATWTFDPRGHEEQP